MQPKDLSDRTSSAVSPKTAASLRQALQELERRHGLGESNLCESILAKCPELSQTREAVLELIYLEFVLSEEANRPISAEALQLRFPEYQADLQKILSIDHVFRDQADTPSPADSTIGSQLKIGQATRNDRKLQFDQLGDYELLEVIGQGGMGVVYRARQQRLNRFVAVKTIDVLSSLNPATVARFHNEAELVAKLQHPNIVQIYEVASIQGVPYFSMELVSGGTLAQATHDRPFVPVTAAKIVETLARAVHYAHTKSVVHRDLKPANILLSPSDRSQAIEVPVMTQLAMLDSQPLSTRCEPKIADFGLAKFLEGALDRTATGAMIGTPSYMAPEQIDPALGAIGPACDIYSLGAILYNAMTGSPPFNAATVIETIQQVRTSEVIPPSRLQAKIPRDLENICLKCLRKDQSKRYQTANELADDLQRFLTGQPILARPAGLVERNWKWARRHPSLTAFLAAVFLAAIGMTFLWLKSEHSRRGEREALHLNDRLMYDRDIALAQFEYQSSRIGRSREILEKTRADFRGWEWGYLRNQSAACVWESAEQTYPIHHVDISPGGRDVAWVNRGTKEDHNSIMVWDIAKNEQRWRLQFDDPRDFTDVRFSSDGLMLLSSSPGPQKKEGETTTESLSSVCLWDLRTGTIFRNISSSSHCTLSRFSTNGKSIFVGQDKACVTEYSLQSGDFLQRHKSRHVPGEGVLEKLRKLPLLNEVMDIDFNPDGTQMAVASLGTGLSLWDTRSGEEIQSITNLSKYGTNSGVHRVDWSPDGKMICFSDLLGMQRLYEFDAGEFKLTNEHQREATSYSRFTPDGRRLVSVEYGKPIEIRTLPSGVLEKSIAAHNGKTYAMSFDSTGRYMVTGGADNRVRLWDLSINDPRFVNSVIAGFEVSAFEFSPASQQIALALRPRFRKDYRLEIRDCASHKLIRELKGHTEPPTCVAYSADGKLLLSGSLDKSVRLWQSDSDTQSWVLAGHEAPISGVAFLNGTPLASSIDDDGVLKIWNVENKTLEKTYKLNTRVKNTSFHPQRPLAAIVCQDYGVSLWDILLGKQLASVPMTSDDAKVCFSPDGSKLATAGNDPLTYIWLTEELLLNKNTVPKFKVEGHTDKVTSFSFSPDGERLICCSQDESVKLFDIIGGRELIRFDSPNGNDGLIRFSPDGNSIVRTLGGDLSTWTSILGESYSAQVSTKASMVAWHKSEADAAEESKNWFSAQFHLNHLIELEPDIHAYVRRRATIRLLLGDFAGAERDLRSIERIVQKSDTLEFLADCARAYLGQQKWTEYHEVCERLLQLVGNSTNRDDLNTCIWICSLGARSKSDTSNVAQKLEDMMLSLKPSTQTKSDTPNVKLTFKDVMFNPRIREIDYSNTLALKHYRNGDYRHAIRFAEQSLESIAYTDPRLPVESMILALSYAQLDQQWFGWLPSFIRLKIREWGLASSWNLSSNSMASVEAWMMDNQGTMKTRLSVKVGTHMFYKVDLPLLKKEWEEIVDAK